MKARITRAYPAPKYRNPADEARFNAWRAAQLARVSVAPILPCNCGCGWPSPRCGKAVA